jgi:hypothetical protein
MPRIVNRGVTIGERLTRAYQRATRKRGTTVPYLYRGVSVASVGLLLGATPASTSNAVLVWNRPVCGSSYVAVDLGKGDYFNVMNASAGNTCITAEEHHLSWYVASWHKASTMWQYPNISSGIEWGRYTCNDGPSAAPSSPGSECMRYPVPVDKDGTPLTSASVHPNISYGNVAYDIWVNRTDVAPSKLSQPNGAEVMVWLDYPGIRDEANARHVVLDGIAWDVMTWVARNKATGITWRYVAYLAHRQRDSVSGLWLNAFLRNAEKAGELSPSWYLTAIDFGAEINQTVSGHGFDVASYSLTGVR